MKKMKKYLPMLLVFALSLLVLSGCSKNANDEKDNTKTSSDNVSVKDINEESKDAETKGGELYFPELPNNTLSLTASIPNFGTSPEGTVVQEKWQSMMEEYLGVKLDIDWNIVPWSDYRSSEKVLLQSGDIADVATYSQGNYINEYGSDGIVLDILKYKDYMQYYQEFVKETNGGEAYAYNQDGTAYYFMDGFSNPENLTGAQSFTAFSYRFDVLKKLGLKPATTLNEFTELVAKLQEAINNEEIDAKYVISNQDKGYTFYRGFVGIFHTWDTLYWNGSEWAFGPIEDNFREMLKYLNGLYKKGYIDPEFTTDDSDASTQKAVTGNHIIVPTLWAGMARAWNTQSAVDGLEWGLAYLPENEDYGTAWKWGSKQDGKSIQNSMGIFISADTKYPEYVVRMIDYQYSDEMIEMMNWGIEGETYTVDGSGNHTFTDIILNADDPVQVAAKYGIMSSSANRTGIPFTPLTFEAMTEQISEEPWWNENDGYYPGQYWIESGRIGGAESVSPFDCPPVLYLDDSQSTDMAELTTNCNTYARENALKFILGDIDIYDDAAWQSYKDGVKSQASNFDETINMLLEKSDLSSISK